MPLPFQIRYMLLSLLSLPYVDRSARLTSFVKNKTSVISLLKHQTCTWSKYILSLFVLDTPRHGKSSNGGLLTAPREFHPSEDRSELSPLVATARGLCFRFNAQLYGQTGVSLHCLSSPYRGQPDIYSRSFLARHTGQRTNKLK